jgi:hypothetical protein
LGDIISRFSRYSLPNLGLEKIAVAKITNIIRVQIITYKNLFILFLVLSQ